MRKRFLFLTILAILFTASFNSFGQINCVRQTLLSGCNYIGNNDFTPQGLDPSNINHLNFPINYSPSLIPGWSASHGSPSINPPNTNPPSPATNSIYMFSNAGSGEGLVQRIPRLIPGNKYLLSFFEKVSSNSIPLENFNVVLLQCDDYLNFPPPPDNIIPVGQAYYTTPAIPSNSQSVVCQTNLVETNWKQVTCLFTATSNYNMIWMFPNNITNGTQIWIAYPELIDVTTFSAGSSPTPIYPNCNVTIGTTSLYCTVAGATYTWHGPNNQHITPPNLPSTQITINAGDPQNTGPWTLEMSVPGAISGGNCASPGSIRSTVTVPYCGIEYWPKVYWSKHPEFLRVSDFGQVYLFLHYADLSMPIHNHQGAYPPITFPGLHTIHYNSAGVTNWGLSHTGHNENLPLLSGDIQIMDLGGAASFYDGMTGNQVPGPTIPAGHAVLAELNDGRILTKYRPPSIDTDILSLISSTGQILFQINVSGSFYKYTFNRNSNRLFAHPLLVQNPGFREFSVVGNTIQQGQPAVNDFELIQIDDQDNIFVIRNGSVQQFRYDLNPTIFQNPPSIPGFNNSNIQAIYSNAAYTQNTCLVLSVNDGHIYELDFANRTQRSIALSSVSHFGNMYYCIKGNNAYFSGLSYDPSAIIGNQSIPYLHQDFNSFITKLNLTVDFQRPLKEKLIAEKVTRPQNPSVSIYPNPSHDMLNLRLSREFLASGGEVNISIFDGLGRTILKQTGYSPKSPIRIESLKRGIYFIHLENGYGKTVRKTFIKL